jgi:hypothetical protein
MNGDSNIQDGIDMGFKTSAIQRGHLRLSHKPRTHTPCPLSQLDGYNKRRSCNASFEVGIILWRKVFYSNLRNLGREHVFFSNAANLMDFQPSRVFVEYRRQFLPVFSENRTVLLASKIRID